jgi:hypothetical protein
MNWFDPRDDIVVQPSTDRARFWKRRHGSEQIEVAEQVLLANNSMGRWTTDAIYRETWTKAERYGKGSVVSVDMELSALAGTEQA